jgi:hypothetical protein
MAGLGNWSPYQQTVQQNTQDGKFVNASFSLVAAGPPKYKQLAAMGADKMPVVPIGMVQNLAVSHNRVFNRVWEVGSERSYFVPGRAVGQATMGRVLYDGWSLLRVLYGYYKKTATHKGYSVDSLLGEKFDLQDTQTNTTHDMMIPPGYNDFFINLASDLFTQPIGLYFTLYNNNEKPYGAFYLEQCYIPNHSLAMDAQGVIIQESVAVQFENMQAVDVGARAVDGSEGTTPEFI